MLNKKPIIIANWKMKLGIDESKNLTKAVKSGVRNHTDVVLCPSFVALPAVSAAIGGSAIKLGGQDCFWEGVGAFTGEISAGQLKEVGCEFVILGHSERRTYLGETDEMIHKKVEMAISVGLVPIVCVGETFDQRQEGITDYVLIRQVTKAFEGIIFKDSQQAIIAYEPVWVIGSGQAIEPPQAAAAHEVIRQTVLDLFGADSVNGNFRIVYGGSVDSENVKSFTNLENIDGILVGGVSLKALDFITLIKNV